MYRAPVAEQLFVLETTADLEGHAGLPAYSGDSMEFARDALREVAKIAERLFAPINSSGDLEGATFCDGAVRMPQGFAAAYRRFVEGGWSSIAVSSALGGAGMPFVLACAVTEQISSANVALAGCLQLTSSAVEALRMHASEEQKRLYLAKLISGVWTGTMNLTEPQAGSDVGAIRTSAARQADGTYRIKGQKIFITFGEHDMTENIIHLVLARVQGAPAGTRGLSLFIVPKRLVDARGELGLPNDIRCVSIEHKLGIRASPTCVMSYGDNEQCIAYLVGEENAGIRAMFTMMNNARVNVGIQGLALAERAYQAALDYASKRVQSRPLGGSDDHVPIIEHADVKRMLLTARASIGAIRSITYFTAAAIDRAESSPDSEAREAARGRADLLTPVAKAFSTEVAVEIVSLALQVFGGLGFIEETGVAQHYRDVRITPIYEGTTGIQAVDLVHRKLPQDGARHWRRLFEELRDRIDGLEGEVAAIRTALQPALQMLDTATRWMIDNAGKHAAAAGATPYLRAFGGVLGATLLATQAQEASRRAAASLRDSDRAFANDKLLDARFYTEQLLPPLVALLGPATSGGALLRGSLRR